MALIPARGGSKNPPDKNVRIFKGKPLIVHTIEQALQAKGIDRIIVSTDSPVIAELSRRAGAEVPFMRPAEFAQDHSTDFEVFCHALSWLDERESYRPDLIVHLRPTSPLRPSGLIERCIERMIIHPEADSLRTVIVARHTPYKMWQLKGEYLEPLLLHPDLPEPYNLPRQLLPVVYWQNGYVDVTRWTTIMVKRSMTGSRVLGYVMDVDHDVDIDRLEDIERAESIGGSRFP